MSASGTAGFRPAANRRAEARRSTLRIAWHEGITVVRDGEDLALESHLGSVRLRRVPNGVAEALTWLAQGAFTVDELSDHVLTTDGPEQLHRLYFHVNELAARGLLRHSVHADGAPLATLEAVSRYHRFEQLDVAGDFVLSRFALLRRDGAQLVIESPLGHARVLLHDDRGAAFVAKTMRAADDTAAGMLLLLRNARAVVRAGEEESNPVLAQWNFHDLYFHTRSRFGRHANPFGATFRHAGAIEPLPAIKEPPRGESIALPRFEARDDDFERRRTIYGYDDAHPITSAQLAEFLHRVARVRDTFEVPVPDREDVRIPVSSRPYPSGGKSYELEFYLAVASCDGLAAGLYHYDPLGHRLTRIRERDGAVDALLHYATIAAPNIRRPQIMITLAARFQRVSWKYDSIAYAATLKHVGVLYQMMYLVATEMGLAPCALGSGDSDLFATAAGTDYLVETSVGEFLLGSVAS
jgi:SagB-type dehydrogenase family enzyme